MWVTHDTFEVVRLEHMYLHLGSIKLLLSLLEIIQ
jgi:hypothetical protein